MLLSAKSFAIPTPYVIWCTDNNTLYFSIEEPEDLATPSYKGHSVGQCWSGEEVVNSTTSPKWFNYKSGTSKMSDNVTKIVIDPSFTSVKPKNCSSWFAGLRNVTQIEGLENLDTSEATSMYNMFGIGSTELNLSNFNTSNVTNMSAMFSNCSSLTELDLSNFDTSKVTDMSHMFSDCSSLTELDLSNFDTSNVTDMCFMFDGCSSLTALNLDGFDTSNVTNLCCTFENCSSLTYLDISGFDTSKCTDTSCMFMGCTNLETLKISLSTSSIDTEEENSDWEDYCDGMFSDCSNLSKIYITDLYELLEEETIGLFILKQLSDDCNWPEIYVDDDQSDAWSDLIDDNNFKLGYDTGYVTITIPSYNPSGTNYGTFSSRYYALDFSNCDIKAYVGSFFDAATTELTVTNIKTIVPARTGIIVKGTAGQKVQLPVVTANSNVYVANLFTAATTDTDLEATTGTYTNYYLTNGSLSSVEAYLNKYGVSSLTIPAGHAYLQIPTSLIPAGSKLRIVFGDGETPGEATYIEEIKDNNESSNSKTIYNFSGQRISAPTKGLNIINGKKALVK